MPNPADWFTNPTPHPAALRPPSPCKLALASLPLIVAKSASGFGRGEGICPLNGHGLPPSPHPHPLADGGYVEWQARQGELAGEGWGEGAFAEALSRIWYD